VARQALHVLQLWTVATRKNTPAWLRSTVRVVPALPRRRESAAKSRIARQYCQHLINVRAEPASLAQVDVDIIARMRSGYAVTAGRREIQASASFTLVVYKIPTTRSVGCDARHKLLYFFLSIKAILCRLGPVALHTRKRTSRLMR